MAKPPAIASKATPITTFVRMPLSGSSSYLSSSFSSVFFLLSDFLVVYFLTIAGSPFSTLILASLTSPLSSSGFLLGIPILSASRICESSTTSKSS